MQIFKPYPHQERCLRAINKVRKEGLKSELVVMASGTGKTVVAGFDVRRFLRNNRGARVLYLCHQNDILRQARVTFEESVLPQRYTHGYLNGPQKDLHEVTCLYASFQTMTLHRTLFRRDEFDIVVVDESHHSAARTYLPTLKYFQPKVRLAITATPDRMDQQDISQIYGGTAFRLELEDAWAEGLLTPVDYRVVTDELQNLKVLETPIGRLSITQLNKTIFIKKRDAEVVRIIESKVSEIPAPRVVIFSPRIDHCEHLAKIMPQAVAIHSRLSAREQEERLDAFRAGQLRTVLTVDKFNEGIDVPEANVIVFLRSTASRTIFFQQLGRGLRKSPGKDKVLVLDFVANCDRLVMLEELRRGVNERLTTSRVHGRQQPVHLDIGRVKFDEVVLNVLEVIRKIRAGYTKDDLIRQLQSLAIDLGRTPTLKEVGKFSKQRRCASPPTFQNYFGTYTAAVIAAGLDPNVQTYTTSQLLRQLRQLGKQLGRTPRISDHRDATAEGKIIGVDTYVGHFGSYTAAIEAAGFQPNQRRYTKGALIEQLKAVGKHLGRTPTVADLVSASKERRCASLATFQKCFGSHSDALKAAGFEQRQKPTRKGLIQDLQKLALQLGQTPTSADVSTAYHSGEFRWSVGTLQNVFGTFSGSLIAAGLRVKKPNYTKPQMLQQLRRIAKKLGHSPTSKEVAEASKYGDVVSRHVLATNFGGYNAAIIAAGLKPAKMWSRKN